MDAFVWSILMVYLSSIYLDENRVYCTVLLTQLSIRDIDTFVKIYRTHYDIEITIAIDQLFLRKGRHLSYCQFSAIQVEIMISLCEVTDNIFSSLKWQYSTIFCEGQTIVL